MSVAAQVMKLYEALYKASDGRVGHRMIGVPTLLLITTGAKSGVQRTSALVYARDGADYLLVASNGGSEKPPAWLANIRAKPEVEIQIARRRMKARARVLESSEQDYERLWRLVNQNNHDRYAAYQRGTSRPIPLVALTPA